MINEIEYLQKFYEEIYQGVIIHNKFQNLEQEKEMNKLTIL